MFFFDLTILNGSLILVLLSMIRDIRRDLVQEIVNIPAWVGIFIATLFLGPLLPPFLSDTAFLGTSAYLFTPLLAFFLSFLLIGAGFLLLGRLTSMGRPEIARSHFHKTFGKLSGMASGIILFVGASVTSMETVSDTRKPAWLTQMASCPLLRSFSTNPMIWHPNMFLSGLTNRLEIASRIADFQKKHRNQSRLSRDHSALLRALPP